MIRPIIKYPDNFLRKKSRYREFNLDLIQDLKETMKANEGAGLSAVQIGNLDRGFVSIYDVNVNPVIISSEGHLSIKEGCLSIPGKEFYITRASKVKVEYTNENFVNIKKTLIGIEARVFLHEYDHLEGKLIIDYQ